MTDSTSDFISAELPSHLKNESSALRAFVELLKKEQEALLIQDSDLLLALAEEKTLATQKIVELSNRRRQSLTFKASNLDTTEWIENNAPGCRSAWAEIRELAARAHQINQTNGEVIQLRLRSNQKALTILLSATENAAGLYGRDGQPNLPISGRTLGSG